MSQLPALYEPWWTRALRAVGVLRQLEPGPERHNAGSDFAAGTPAAPGYSVQASMAAYAAFPWVYACANAIAQDLARLPVKVKRDRPGGAEELFRHPVALLMQRPSERIRGDVFRRQRVLDRLLSGNAYTLLVGGARPTSLIRLHPSRVEIIPDADGQPKAYRYDGMGQSVVHPWSVVSHVRAASWEDGPEGLFGQGLIRALHFYLNADRAAWARQADANRKGRPDAILSPESQDPAMTMWTPQQVREIRERVEQLFSDTNGGVAVLNAGLKLEMLSWSPTDLGSGELSDRVRVAVMAAAGVPPVRLGLETANYATAKEQLRSYWENTIMPLASEFDEADTEIARRWGDDLWVARDFSNVAPLQEDRSARQARVREWYFMGLSLADAAAYEGFDDLPQAEGRVEPAPVLTPAAEDDAAKAVAKWLAPDAVNRGGDVLSWKRPASEQERAAVWRGFVDDLHAPAERALFRMVDRYLEGARRRYARRVGEVLGGDSKAVTRHVGDADLAKIVDALGEDGLFTTSSRPEIEAAIRKAFERAARALPGDGLAWDPSRSPAAHLIANLVQQVNDVTREAVRSAVLEGLAEGASIREIQDRIKSLPEFARDRALRVARTESTRAVNSGAVVAYEDAANQGVKVRKEWLSSRDDAVRDTHAELDGQTVSVGEEFMTSSGDSAQYPGGFSSASEVVNCRCTVLPVLEE